MRKAHPEAAHRQVDDLERAFTERVEMLELAEAEGDDGLVAEAEAALTALGETASLAELQTLLSGEADGNDCFIEVHPGAGGTESQDWAEMLMRMYLRWAEKRGYKPRSSITRAARKQASSP